MTGCTGHKNASFVLIGHKVRVNDRKTEVSVMAFHADILMIIARLRRAVCPEDTGWKYVFCGYLENGSP